MDGSTISVILLVFILHLDTVTVADNGVKNRISDVCLECIKRVQPSPEKECLPANDRPEILQCGPYRMKQIFYDDCRLYWDSIPEEWNTWRKCYEIEECSKSCVEAYHNYYADVCFDSKPISNESLTCVDYGQMHFSGPFSCGKPEFAATEAILNMTLQCGCETVYGNREQCLADMEKECEPSGLRHTDIVIIVGVVCASIVTIVSVVVVTLCCCKYKRSSGLLTCTKTTGVDARRFRVNVMKTENPNGVRANIPPATHVSNQVVNEKGFVPRPYSPSLHSPPFLAASPVTSPVASPPASPIPAAWNGNSHNSMEKFDQTETQGNEESLPRKIERAASISSGSAEGGIEPGYVNVTSISVAGSSTKDDRETLTNLRAPIPAPRD